ncbi:LysE family transporter [Candidatus Microgenomates bacterium]|nr:LysE family transporter [Candidatus Microgenomates bacterium]
MENLVLIGTILAIHIFAWFTPGPLFVLIVRNSLVYSRKTGIWTAVGIAAGNVIHITYSITGIALIISTSDIAFSVIKFLGVGYLAYLGIKTLLVKIAPQKASITLNEHKDISPFSAVKIGFLTNILSPMASLFFASIFATVMGSGAPFWVVVFLWIAMPLNSFIMSSILSTFFTQKRVRVVYTKYENIVNKFLGVALLAFAIIIALH